MKKYILTIIGKFDSIELCQDIAISLTPIVDSPNLKFQHSQGILLFHFDSEVSKDEIFDFVNGVLFEITESYILTELSDNVTLSLPSEVKSHLLDLNGTDDDIPLRSDLKKKNYSDFDEIEEDDFVDLLLKENRSFFKKPTLDQILDKINLKGMDSLTPFEKDILESFS